MPHVLPNLSDTALIRYGIPEIYAAMPHLFADRPVEQKQTIAIIDNGVDLTKNHYDLWRNPIEVPDNGIDDDGNGFIDDPWGWDFYTRSGDMTYSGGHGREVAKALTAACPELIAVMNATIAHATNPSLFMMLDAMLYAAKNGAIAANSSYLVISPSGMSRTLQALRDANCVWLAPAGGNAPTKAIEYSAAYPAWYGDDPQYPNLMVTGAIDPSGNLRSQYSPNKVAVLAYAWSASFGSPIPGGIMALLKTVEPSLSATELVELVCAGAEHEGRTEEWCRYGIINHKRSLEKLLGHSIGAVTVPVPEPAPTPEPEEPVIIDPTPDPTYPRTLADGESVKFTGPTEIVLSLPEGGEVVGDGVTIIKEVRQ